MHQHSPGTAHRSACDAVSPNTLSSVQLSAVRLRKDGLIGKLFLLKGQRDIEDSIVQPTPAFLASPERLAAYAER